jgi:hypothetical protein
VVGGFESRRAHPKYRNINQLKEARAVSGIRRKPCPRKPPPCAAALREPDPSSLVAMPGYREAKR